MRSVLSALCVSLVCSGCGGAAEQPSSSSVPAITPRSTFTETQTGSIQTLGDSGARDEPSAITAEVFVNSERLSAETLQQIERTYGVPVKPGRYWYDPVTGVWGLEGGPSAGRIAPNLSLGGRLREDASKGNTGVFVNGRELHALDVQALNRCVQSVPGRYWVAANGVGGYEGGPPFFDLNALCRAAGGGSGGGMQCEDSGGGQFNCGRADSPTGTYGVIGEGGGQAGIFTDQGLIMTP
jgi:hypothetical protein